MKIVLTADHAGRELALKIKEYLTINNYQVIDYIPTEFIKTDSYAKNSIKPRKILAKTKDARGVFICGTGVGMCISANRQKGVRAAVCTKIKEVELSRLHDDINCLCLGARVTQEDKALNLVNVFLNSPFEGGRHQIRIKQLG